MAIEITTSNFEETILKSDKLAIIDFWADWCGPCRAIAPIISELSAEYEGKVIIGKVNVDTCPEISNNYAIRSIPTLVFFKDGKVIDKIVGSNTKANIVKKIEAHI